MNGIPVTLDSRYRALSYSGITAATPNEFELEEALRTNRPFSYDYHSTQVPVLFGPSYWLPKAGDAGPPPDFLETLIGDPAICRLYLRGRFRIDVSGTVDRQAGRVRNALRRDQLEAHRRQSGRRGR